MRTATRREPAEVSVAGADVLAEVLRPPYIWWLLLAIALQTYAPIYVLPVAVDVVAMAVLCARRAVASKECVASEG